MHFSFPFSFRYTVSRVYVHKLLIEKLPVSSVPQVDGLREYSELFKKSNIQNATLKLSAVPANHI
jgi:hypothetical protein